MFQNILPSRWIFSLGNKENVKGRLSLISIEGAAQSSVSLKIYCPKRIKTDNYNFSQIGTDLSRHYHLII